MKIVSKYKDFYDYLQFQYGQDLNIYWKRDDIIPLENDEIYTTFSPDEVSSGQPHKFIVFENKKLYEFGKLTFYQVKYAGIDNFMRYLSPYYIYNPKWKYHFYYVYISILGNTYPIIRLINKEKKTILFKLFTYEVFSKLPSGLYEYQNDVTEDNFNSILESFKSRQKEELLLIHRKYNAPIFLYTFIPVMGMKYPQSVIYLRCETPLLIDYQGLVNELGNPEDLYKSIYNFFIEQKNNKDIDPPVELNNKEKIVKAGFDLKQSFRHRK